MTNLSLDSANAIAEKIRERRYFSNVIVSPSERGSDQLNTYGIDFCFEGRNFRFESRIYSQLDGYQLVRNEGGLVQILAFADNTDRLLHKICSKNVLNTTLDYYMDEVFPSNELDELKEIPELDLSDDDFENLFADLDDDDEVKTAKDTQCDDDDYFADFEDLDLMFNEESESVVTHDKTEPAVTARIENPDQVFDYNLEVVTSKKNGEFFLRKVFPMTKRGKLYKEVGDKVFPLNKDKLIKCSLTADGIIPDGYELRIILSKKSNH